MDKKPWSVNAQMVRAIIENKNSIVESILDGGFDIDSELSQGITAINMAILNNCFDTAKLLINRSCSLSLKTDMGSTPLHLAVQMCSYDLVKLFIENRADLSEVDILGKTPLHIACEMHMERIALLIIQNSKMETINLIDKEGKTPLLLACAFATKAIVQALLQKGARVNNIDCFGNNALIHAVTNPNCVDDIVDLLLEAGIDINQRNRREETALLKVCELLSENINSKLQSTCILLIDKGSDVNARNDLNDTPLHHAVVAKNIFIVRKLLNVGCDVNAMNAIGIVPLTTALQWRMYDIAILLLDAGANVNHVWDATQIQFISRHALSTTEAVSTLYESLINGSHKCENLSYLCRQVIRKHLGQKIDKCAQKLPLPNSLIKFVQLIN